MSITATAPFPRLQLAAVATVLGGALLCASFAKFNGYGASPAPLATPSTSIAMTFTDMPDGSVAVRNGANQLIASIPARAGGFIRSTMRVLATERARRNIGPAQAFTVTSEPDGTFDLTDPATGETLDLSAFGPTNETQFANLFFASEAHK